MKRAVAALLTALCAGAHAAPAASLLPFSRDEVTQIVRHGPWPPPLDRDPSNRASGNARTAEFGAQLFFDTRLSLGGRIACATCPVSERAWTDGRARAVGLEATDRNTPSVINARFNRWFGWAGTTDSLWAASQHDALPAFSTAMLWFVLPLTAAGILASAWYSLRTQRTVGGSSSVKTRVTALERLPAERSRR